MTYFPSDPESRIENQESRIGSDPRILDRLRKRLTAAGDGSIGTLAVARGWISQDQLRTGLREAKRSRKSLGEVLVNAKALTSAQLEELILAK